jgi:hypothetical protein
MRRHLELIPQVDFQTRHDPAQCGQLAALIPWKLLRRDAIRDAISDAISALIAWKLLRRESIGDAISDAISALRMWST